MLCGHPARGLPINDLLIGRLQGFDITNIYLLLPGAGFGVIPLHLNPLGNEGISEIIDKGMMKIH